MDKRRLYEDLADMKKVIFAATSVGAMVIVFGVALWAHHNPLNLHAIVVWTVGSFVVFGIAGILLGNLYERIVEAPLIESFRNEARDRINALKTGDTERLQVQWSSQDLQPGMKVVHQVNHPESGALLLRPGAVLTARLIRNLQDGKIEKVTVEAQRSAVNEASRGESPDDQMIDL